MASRPYHLYNDTIQAPMIGCCYVTADNAHIGAVKKMRFIKVGTTFVLRNHETGNVLLYYHRGVSDVHWTKGKHVVKGGGNGAA